MDDDDADEVDDDDDDGEAAAGGETQVEESLVAAAGAAGRAVDGGGGVHETEDEVMETPPLFGTAEGACGCFFSLSEVVVVGYGNEMKIKIT